MVRDSILADEGSSGAEGWLVEEDTNRGKREKSFWVGFGRGRKKKRKKKRGRRWSCGSSGKATLGLDDFRLNVLFHSLLILEHRLLFVWLNLFICI